MSTRMSSNRSKSSKCVRLCLTAPRRGSHLTNFIFRNESAPSFSQFTHIAKEDNNKIGCALMNFQEFTDELWYGAMLTCNYRKTNILTQQVYTTGEPASECPDWGSEYEPSEEFPYLCEKKQVIEAPPTTTIEPKQSLDSNADGFNDNTVDYCDIERQFCQGQPHIGCSTNFTVS